MDREEEDGRLRHRPTFAMMIAVMAWIWPIGIGGEMPVGGDVTNFSIGLMAELGRSIRAGRLPLWNELWGFGFPGLAESQMGVYYPPHLLYGLLPVEWAYTLLMVGHAIWAALGASWASRRFGAGARGAAVAGFAFATSGFFLIHLPHHWGGATASWMPWAWGLTWLTATGRGGRRAPLGLAAVLTLQVLPGHFQLAFITQVTAALLALYGLAVAGEGVGRWRRALNLGLAVLGVAPLSLAQLGPTAELAGLASSKRTTEYLATFAAPPTHLVTYVAPGLFRGSPLWRPLAWDAFHAIPEEHLATIGLVPLFLAGLALAAGGRRDPTVRALSMVALVATALSLGPYLPGFATLCRLPGFSYFRAPARWGSAAMLALSILGGRGLGAWAGLPLPGRRLRRFVLIAAAVPALMVGGVEFAVAAYEPIGIGGRPSWPVAASWLQRGFDLIPWPDEPTLGSRLAEARRPSDDLRVGVALARQGVPFADPADRTLIRRRGSIYLRELGPTYALLALLFAASFLSTRGGRRFETALLIVLLVESLYWSRQRPFDFGPIRPLTEQSAVLGKLAGLPRGTRSIDPGRNLAMVTGVAPVDAYRTLDLPAMVALTRVASSIIPASPAEVALALRGLGVGVRVVTATRPRVLPDEPASIPGWGRTETIADPTLLGWLYGTDWVRTLGRPGPVEFAIWRPTGEPTRAWYVSSLPETLPRGDDPRSIASTLERAKPLRWRSDRPEDVRVEVEADGPGSVVLSQLDYPRWRATLSGPEGERAVPIVRAFDGWQAVGIPGAGPWTLRLRYDGRRDRLCLGISALAWSGWVLLYWGARRGTTVAVGEEGR